MKKPHATVPTSFGTVGIFSRSVRQLLKNDFLPGEADERPVAFCLANSNIGPLPDELECRAWMHLHADSDDDPVLVIVGEAERVAVYVAVNLAERATVSALTLALHHCEIELALSGEGTSTSHSLIFSPSEELHLQALLAEYAQICPSHNPGWISAFSADVSRLPALCQHLHWTLGARVVVDAFSDDLSGVLIRRKGEIATIAVNGSHSPLRRRFTIAHECGHLVLDHEGEIFVDKHTMNRRDSSSSLAVNEQEIQANQFAASVLMPREDVVRCMNDFLGSYRSHAVLVDVMASAFRVSKAAMEVRLVNLGLVAPNDDH